eukprot:TRINITY_DN10518_c0_g3_i2.p1 TRINITY_DN10518_c0_g3~~TRINITY_DN10518_c0_g3_i2.p1  ORF type:complete len:224 (-),score=6.26 TRINITY_DN10518_c0_g3_i2:212-883(-)
MTVESLLKCLKRCPYMSILDVSQNHLTGAITNEALTSIVTRPEFITRLPLFPSLIRANFSSNDISGTINQYLAALSALEVLDLSDNLLRGTIPNGITNFAILVSNNPYLQASALPSFLQFGTSIVLYPNSQQEPRAYACREIVPRNSALNTYRISIDPTYLSYSHCICSIGFYGSPPDCFSWRSHIEYVDPQGTLTDTAFGNRIRTGLSTQFFIQPPLTQANK